MKSAKKIFITDCEGPVSKNDNAFELTYHFIPEGGKFYTQISRYDDILADIIKPKGYKAGDTLKLILPFLKAYGVTNKKMMEFSTQTILLMPQVKETLQFLNRKMRRFIVSTSYEHYIKALCLTIGFPFRNTYCTKLDIDQYSMNKHELLKIKQFSREICTMPLISLSEHALKLHDISDEDQRTVERLNEIFWKEIMQLEIGKMLREVEPVGGVEKANAARNIAKELESELCDIIYVGDSITDVEIFKLIRQHDGVTISFNGNSYAVREAEIAVLSKSTIIIAAIADVFNRFGKESVLNMVDNWSSDVLEKNGINQRLLKKFLSFTENPPTLSRITKNNMQELSKESNTFRRLVRGEKIGRLG